MITRRTTILQPKAMRVLPLPWPPHFFPPFRHALADDLLKRVEAACHDLVVPAGDSYLRSYPLLLAHVAKMTDSVPLDEGALVVVAHLAYG